MARTINSTASRGRAYADVLAYMAWMHAAWKQPTIREIGEYMGWSSSSTVARHLGKMEEMGLVSNVAGKPRMKRVTEAGMAYAREYGGKLHESTGH